MRTLLAFALIVWIGLAYSDVPPQTPRIKAEQKTEQLPKDQGNSKQLPVTPVAKPPAEAKTTSPEANARHSEEDGTEFWPPFLGVRVKITDSLLVLFTFVLAIFTGLLWRSTDNLWTETKAAGATAEKTAEAAKRSAQVSEAALVITQRAYLAAKEYRAEAIRDDSQNIVEWKFSVVWENSGNTPANKVQSGLTVTEVQRDGKDELKPFGLTNPDIAASLAVGPRNTFTSTGSTKGSVAMDQVKRIMSGDIDVFLCGLADYVDIFPASPRRHSEFCMRLIIEDRTFARANPFRYDAYEKFNEVT